MIKRFDKMKKSKRGSLLIIVVLVLALAMIFISAAMMLTQSTKSRLYGNAMSSQARLTVTAASEVFLEALEMQEITDEQFDRMLLGADKKSPKWGPYNGTNPRTRIKMVIPGVPGMSETDPTNCTYLDLYYPVDNNADKKIVFADFSTVIGDEIENVQIRLKVDPEKKSNVGNNFKNQVEIASSIGVSQLRFSSGVGMYDYDQYPNGSPRDNTILCRDDYFENADSSSMFFSDIVVAGNGASDKTVFCYGQKVGIYGDMIFLDNAYLTTHASNEWGIHGDIYFLGTYKDTDPFESYDVGFYHFKDGGWAHDASKPNQNINDNARIVFSGRGVYKSGSTWSHGGDGVDPDNGKINQLFTASTDGGFGNANRAYFVDKDGNALAETSINKSNTNNKSITNNKTASSASTNTGYTAADGSAKTYTVAEKVSYYQNTYKVNSGSFPTAADAFKDITMDVKQSDGTWKTVPLSETYPYAPTDSMYKTLNFNPKTSGGLWEAGKSMVLNPGYYLITGDVNIPWDRNKGDVPFVVYIDGSKAEEYRFWFQGGKNFQLNSIVFALYNVSDETDKHSTIFVLEKDATIFLSGYQSNNNLKGPDDVLCSSGFLSMPRGGKTSVAAEIAGSYEDQAVSHKKNATENWTYFNDKDIKYSKYYDGKNRPAIFIFGVDGNEFKISYGTVLEAYIGIYGSGSFGVKEGTPNIEIEPGKSSESNYAGNLGGIIPIYGRIEANSFKNGNSGNQPQGNILMPYCPQPATESKVNPQRPAVSKYHVTDVVYYYNNPTNAVPVGG